MWRGKKGRTLSKYECEQKRGQKYGGGRESGGKDDEIEIN